MLKRKLRYLLASTIIAAAAGQPLLDSPFENPGGALINGDDDAVTETINVANFSGQTTIDVTQINGVSLPDLNFSHIHYSFENVLTAGAGANVEFGIRLGTGTPTPTFLSSSYSGLVYFGTGTVAARTEQLGIGDNGANAYLSGLLMHLNSAGVRTICKGVNGGLAARHAVSRHDTAAAHTAIQFRVRSDASNVTFSSGFIHLTGYRKPVSKINVQSFNLTTTPAANVVYNVPAGHTMVSAIVTGVTKNIANSAFVRVGKDGVLLSGASDYHSTRFQLSGEASENRSNWLLAGSATAAMTGVIDFLNINTLAPVIVDAHLRQSADSFQAGGVLRSASQKNNTISFGTFDTQLMNAGTVTFISYNVRTEVTQITANSGTTTQTLATNLKKAPMIALATTNLVMSGNANIRFQSGIGGVFDITAGDYRHILHRDNAAAASAVETSGLFDGLAGSTTHNFGAMLLGMTENQFATALWGWGSEVGVTPDGTFRSASMRDDDKSNDSLRSISAANFTSGTIYRTDYKWN